MSKSLENYFTIEDIISKDYDPVALRYLYLGAHYKKPMNFTWQSLEGASKGLKRLQSTVNSLRSTDRTVLSQEKNIKIEEYQTKFREAVSDDLNTSKAMAVMFEMLKSNIPSEDKYDLSISFDEILGLRLK